MAKFLVAVDAPGGTGRIELTNAKFINLHTIPAALNKWDFGDCDEQNLRFDKGRHIWFNAEIEPSETRWFVRLYGKEGKCYMWIEHNGIRYARNYSDGESSVYEFRGRDLLISEQQLASVSVEQALATA